MFLCLLRLSPVFDTPNLVQAAQFLCQTHLNPALQIVTPCVIRHDHLPPPS